MSSETHTAAYTHTQMHAIAVRDKPRLLPRFPVACPGPGPPPPRRCTLPASIHAASGALELVFPRRPYDWLTLLCGPLKPPDCLEARSCVITPICIILFKKNQGEKQLAHWCFTRAACSI